MDAQGLIVVLLLAAAAAFLLRRLWRNARGHSDGACDKCAQGAATKEELL